MDRKGNLAMNRRIFLRGVGGLTLAAPLLNSLNEAKGQAASDPKRLVGVDGMTRRLGSLRPVATVCDWPSSVSTAHRAASRRP